MPYESLRPFRISLAAEGRKKGAAAGAATLSKSVLPLMEKTYVSYGNALWRQNQADFSKKS